MWFAPFAGMKNGSATRDVLIDLLVPARFASRYRARVTSLSPREADLRFAYCPSLFTSGVLVSCPATLSIARGPNVIGSRGILWIGPDSEHATARFEFEKPMSASDLEVLRRICHLDAPSVQPLEAVSAAASYL
jgi:hypothetical protein